MFHFQPSKVSLLETTNNLKTQRCVIVLPCQTLGMAQQTNIPFTLGPLTRTQWQQLGYSYVSEAKKSRVYAS